MKDRHVRRTREGIGIHVVTRAVWIQRLIKVPAKRLAGNVADLADTDDREPYVSAEPGCRYGRQYVLYERPDDICRLCKFSNPSVGRI